MWAEGKMELHKAGGLNAASYTNINHGSKGNKMQQNYFVIT
jgi:hypothetical protein